MDAHVHYGLTRRWAIEAGFSAEEAEAIARADEGVDRDAPRRPAARLELVATTTASSARTSWRAADARARSRRVAGGPRRRAAPVQDTVAHGWLGLLSHVLDPRVDLWDHRSQRVRDLIETRSREMLRRGGRAATASGADAVRAR